MESFLNLSDGNKCYEINRYNLYDFTLVLIVALLVVGDLGGALQPVRLISLLLFPLVLKSVFKINLIVSRLALFFLFWFGYIFISLIWTSNFFEGVKEVFYYFTHFILFMLIQVFSKRAYNPLKSIIYGWLLFFMLSTPIALYELFTDWHFPSSQFSSNYIQNLGDGLVYQKKFSAINFLNYNTYVTILCFSTPFIFAYLLIVNRVKLQIVGWLNILFLLYILLMNASRGGIICFFLYLILFVFFYKHVRFRAKNVILFILSVILLGVFIFYSSLLFEQIQARFVARTSIFEDSSRWNLIHSAMKLFLGTWGIGTGVGSIETSMRYVSSGVVAPHNLFFEILVQYGLLIFVGFLMFIFGLFKCVYRYPYRTISKFIIYGSVLSLPFVFVINAGYLLMPSFWVYISSLLLFSYKNNYYGRLV